jgi:hypothetical protein
MKAPRARDVSELLKMLKHFIEDEFRAYDGMDDGVPSMLVTVGCSSSGDWGYQTGDTQFHGDAYFYPFWGQAALTRRSNCMELAREIIDEIRDAQADA